MSQENKITLRGYLTADPAFYQRTAENVPLTVIRLGSTPRRLDRATGEWRDGPTTYYRVRCWRRLAASAKSSLSKGDRVIVLGNLSLSNWVDSQQRMRTTVEVEAESIGPDLAHGWAVYTRGRRSAEGSSIPDLGEVARQETGAADDDLGGAGFGPAAAAFGQADEGAASPELPSRFEAGTAADPAAAGEIAALARDIDALEQVPVPF